MIVSKFGGSATTNNKSIENVKQLSKNTDRNIFVFSAIGKNSKNDEKITDLLYNYTKINPKNKKAQEKIKNQIILKFNQLCRFTKIDMDIPSQINKFCAKFMVDNDVDFFVSRGEYLTSLIMSKYLDIKFVPAENAIFLKNGKINWQKTEQNLKKLILKHKRIVIPGFYAMNEIATSKSINSIGVNKKIKLFTRGGSDLTGAIISKCLGVGIYENWTDVDGIYPINPNLKKTEIIGEMSYNDLKVMTAFDANVIQKDCAKILNGTGTLLEIKNIFNLKDQGSRISSTYLSPAEYIVYKQTKSSTLIKSQMNDGTTFNIKLPKDFNLNLLYDLHKKLKSLDNNLTKNLK